MAKIHGPSKIQAISKIQATLTQRERFNPYQVGHGQFDGNKTQDNFEDELLRYTPFKKEELFAILNTDRWKDPLNEDRLIATFPSLENKINDSQKWEATKVFLDEQPKDLTFPLRRLAALFQDCATKCNTYLSAMDSKTVAYLSLLNLGLTSGQATEVGFYVEQAGKPNPFQHIQDFDKLDDCKDPEQLIEYTDGYKDAYLEAHPEMEYNESLKRDHYDHANMDLYATYIENREFKEDLIKNGFPQQEILTQKNAFYFHHMPMNLSQRPTQGMMLYISCSDRGDYKFELDTIVRDLIECGADFKIANVKALDAAFDSDGKHSGKCITLYEGQWDAAEFFDRNKELFYKDKNHLIHPYGTMNLQGRVAGRYGSFVDNVVVDPKTLIEYPDDPDQAFPPFVDRFTINDFIKACAGEPVDITHSAIIEQISQDTGIPYNDIIVGTTEDGSIIACDSNYKHIADIHEDGNVFICPDYDMESQETDIETP